jgi:hypothetical protein
MPNEMSEWQAAIYLVASSDEIWPALGGPVLHDRSLGPVICERDDPRRPWSSSERQVLVWSAHLWDADRHQARLPYEFDRYNFRRWITAVHLRGGLAPAFSCREPSGTRRAARTERAVESRRPKTSTARVSSEPPELADRQACAAQAHGRRMGPALLPGRPGLPSSAACGQPARPARPALRAGCAGL